MISVYFLPSWITVFTRALDRQMEQLYVIMMLSVLYNLRRRRGHVEWRLVNLKPPRTSALGMSSFRLTLTLTERREELKNRVQRSCNIQLFPILEFTNRLAATHTHTPWWTIKITNYWCFKCKKKIKKYMLMAIRKWKYSAAIDL